MDTSDIRRSAILSSCGLYRYELRRWWVERPMSWVLWILLNPSTADAEEDDNTVVRCMNFSEAWGYDGLIILNLYAYRATDPTDLLAARMTGVDVHGPDRKLWYLKAALTADLAVAGWGTNVLTDVDGPIMRTAMQTFGLPLHYLRLTKAGHPGHPLYLPGGLTPQVWDGG